MDPKRELQEARRHPRSPLGTKGVARFADGRSIPILVLDVSYGGVRIEIARAVDARFLLGKSLTIDIPSLVERSRGHLSPLAAEVVWAKTRENGRTWAGLRFTPAASTTLRLQVPGLGN
jgi:hypothetical protein